MNSSSFTAVFITVYWSSTWVQNSLLLLADWLLHNRLCVICFGSLLLMCHIHSLPRQTEWPIHRSTHALLCFLPISSFFYGKQHQWHIWRFPYAQALTRTHHSSDSPEKKTFYFENPKLPTEWYNRTAPSTHFYSQSSLKSRKLTYIFFVYSGSITNRSKTNTFVTITTSLLTPSGLIFLVLFLVLVLIAIETTNSVAATHAAAVRRRRLRTGPDPV